MYTYKYRFSLILCHPSVTWIVVQKCLVCFSCVFKANVICISSSHLKIPGRPRSTEGIHSQCFNVHMYGVKQVP